MVEAGVAFSSVPQPELPPGAAPGHAAGDCGSLAADAVQALAEWEKNGPSDREIAGIVLPSDTPAPAPRAD